MKLVGVGKVEILRESLRECSSSSSRGLELSELSVYDVFVLQTAQCSREEMRDVLQAYRCRILVSGRVWSIVMVDVVVQHRS